jgi:hypothetical protein
MYLLLWTSRRKQGHELHTMGQSAGLILHLLSKPQ